MQITPPFAYPPIEPLKKTDRVHLPAEGAIPAFCRELHVIPVSFTEVPVAQRDYPIVFVSGDGGTTFVMMAILGLQPRQNLFVDAQGWDRGVYVPAYVRRYPFCMAKVTAEGKVRDERVVCVAQEALAADGEPLYDSEGQATPRWQGLEALLREYEGDMMRTDELCANIAALGLLEPFNMQATTAGGTSLQLTGMYRVAESRLNALDGAQLQSLAGKGVLSRLYAHLMSLENFRGLTERIAAASRTPTPPPPAAAH